MIIIPDVHGRDFWKGPVYEILGKEHIVFLGDYIDPYDDERIPPDDAFSGFQEIVSIKRNHPEAVTLLLGNHDLHYLSDEIRGSRYDFPNAVRNSRFISENATIFEIAHISVDNERKILFTHAGLQRGWVEKYDNILGGTEVMKIVETLNQLWLDSSFRPVLFSMLADIPFSRLGLSPYGSPIWNDVDDMSDASDGFPGWYQIFGHSQQESEPVITDHYACLDCRSAFRLEANQDAIITAV